MKRLPLQPREWIDRSRPLAFTFEGRRLEGFAGDTIASALAGAGVRVVGRSFKYHRPRGLLSVANHDINALFQVELNGRSLPNVRGDATPLEAGMAVRAVNTWGGVAADRGRVLDALSTLLPVGFYYKAFHEFGGRFFPFWERVIRRSTGLGQLRLDQAAQATPKRYDFCDVAVIGAGPSGIAAALAAADAGLDVLLVDENARIGGSAVYAPAMVEAGSGSAAPTGGRAALGNAAVAPAGGSADDIAALVARAQSHPRLRLALSTVAAGWYADQWLPLVGPDYLTKLRAKAVVIAQGAFEQPAVFRHNDTPGVMLASGARRLLHRYALAPCTRLVVLAANAQGYEAALDALAHGIEVVAVLDLRRELPPPSAALANEVARRGVPVARGSAVRSALRSGGLLSGVEYGALRDDGRIDRTGLRTLDCDGLWMSIGCTPANALLHQAGARIAFDDSLQQFVPQELPAGVFACGRVAGVHDLDHRLADGAQAGAAAAAYVQTGEAPASTLRPAARECPNHPWPIVEHERGKNFIDFDEDLQLKDLANAAQEGFDNIELLKRYTTVGMGPSQGKHSNMNAIRVLARLRRRPVGEVGSTTARPMFHPVPLSHLAGRRFSVERETPIAAEHQAAGAVWMLVPPWRRPEYYAVDGLDRDAAIAAEVRAVRERVGLIDVGTLGKIEVHGPDAAEFLERVYTGRFANLKVGMTRYGLMCDEAGVVIDDGVIAQLAPEHFYCTTTTGGAAAVYRELARWNTIWGLRVGLVNLTGHLAAVNLAGPAARAVLRALTDLDLSDAAFPYLGARLAQVAGAPARLLRVGFVGEVGYEIHVPADRAVHLWRALLQAGTAHGIRPFGVEAQRRLRLEKGHIIVGQDSDGLSTPFDLGCEWALKMDKPFFVGQRSLQIVGAKPRRQVLVGFEVPDGAQPKEGELVIEAGEIAGRVTSCAASPTLGKVIGLAFVRPALRERGSFTVRSGGAMVEAKVVPTPFYDAGNERQKLDDTRQAA